MTINDLNVNQASVLAIQTKLNQVRSHLAACKIEAEPYRSKVLNTLWNRKLTNTTHQLRVLTSFLHLILLALGKTDSPMPKWSKQYTVRQLRVAMCI